MKNNRAIFNWLIDLVLFGGFISLFFLEFTGLDVHQWLGLAGGGLALYHLIIHWPWVKAVSQRFFGRTTNQARLYYLVDLPLLLGFFSIIFSGLLISSWLNLDLGSAASGLTALHTMISKITLGLLVFKIAIHWRWIVRTTRSISSWLNSETDREPVLQPVHESRTSAADLGRRDFLKLMGVVGAVSATAAVQISSSSVLDLTQGVTGQTTASSLASSSVSQTMTTTACTACRKNRHCSFPGECRDYTDLNGNGRCDRGECV